VLSCVVTERTTADFFDVAFEPLSADQLQEPESPGGEPNVGEPQGPQNGYLLRVTLKPGLPLGAFRQTILIRTDQESVATIEIPVAGTVVGDISIAGPGWNDQNAVLTLGTLSSREETVWRLLLVVRGPYSKEVQFTLIRTVPDLIEVDQQALTQTTPIGDGTVTQTPLVIRIPEGSRPVNCLGSKLGEILIGTSHPDIPELPIRVRFAVEGG
jgi:hypothetical protein